MSTKPTFEEVAEKHRQFLRERNWGKKEPREFAISLSLEANELLEHYQWSDDPVGSTEELADELADIIMYAIQFADCYDIDIPAAVDSKMKKSATKYPANEFQHDSPEKMREAWRAAKKRHDENASGSTKPTIVICSSANFYEHALQVETELHKLGYNTVVPKSALEMKQRCDFTVQKSWYDNPDDYHMKADYMRSHFDRINESDAVLVVNDEKHGVPGYIGPNVLLEMSLAWYQNKPIYLLNELPVNSPLEEEIKGMSPVVLHGDLTKLEEA